MNPVEKNEIYSLLNALRENMITPEQFERLDYLISSNPEMAEEYLGYVKLWTSLQFFQVASQGSNIISELANVESISPSVEIEKPKTLLDYIESNETTVDTVDQPVGKKRKVIFSLVGSIAACLLVAVGFQISAMSSRVEVATLTDSIGAEWASNSHLENGSRLATNSKSYRLKYGFAELMFDNNAKVTIEGPAEFVITSEDRIKLKYGYAYSSVPPEAIGFAINTPSALVIDLGTQFGIQVSYQGDTELHVLKGKTTLITGDKEKRASTEVSQGLARKVTKYNAKVSEIACDERLFVRDIESKTNLIWRGRPTINLADIIGGGNGWGTGNLEYGIDAITGKSGYFSSEDRRGTGKFMPVNNMFIDGVFVPQGFNNNQKISSEGHIFVECPKTNNVCYSAILNGYGRDLEDYQWRAAHGKLGNRPYGTAEYPSIFMHANLGITFDLEAIRKSLPEGKIQRFVSDVGMSSDTPRDGNFDVWVLVDGELRKSIKGIDDISEVFFIDVALDESDRFLTLVSTDGEDPDLAEDSPMLATDSDWCIFARPYLELAIDEKETDK